MGRERTYRSEGIVLRRSDFGEADRLLTLFTRDYGKLRVLAKGARKPQSRKTGHVELFMRSQFMLAVGRNIDIVTQAELIEPYSGLHDDLVRATYAAYACELVDSVLPEAERQTAVYDLLARALGWFAAQDNPLLAARYFELRLLTLIGYQPQLFYCVASGEPIEQVDQFFSAEEGGLLAPTQRAADLRARPISAAAVKVLRYLQTRSWETVQNLRLRRALHSELEATMHFYLEHVLEKRLRSAEFLYRLRREASVLLPADATAAADAEIDADFA